MATPLDGDFAGTWNGTVTFAMSGRHPVPYSVPVTISLAGNSAQVGNICPGTIQNYSLRGSVVRLPTESARASSTITATGSGSASSWSGLLECPKIEARGCDAVAVGYSEASIALSGPNQLTIVVTGTAEGCGVVYAIFVTFVGSK